MAEQVVLRFHGGPIDGTDLTSEGWPAPPALQAPDTDKFVYVKVRESSLPEGVPGIMRGASYEWLPYAELIRRLDDAADPDESTYPVHAYDPGPGQRCWVCRRDQDASRGTLGEMHLPESEARALHGDA